MRTHRIVARHSLFIAAALLILQATPMAAAVISETFESQTIGSTTPPANWMLFDTTSTNNATYTAINSNIGAPPTSGVAGQVTSLDYTGSGNLPGAYIVHSTAFDSTVPFVGRFDVQIIHEDVNDDITFLVGDIGSGLTRIAGGALVLKLLEMSSSATSAISDGAGTPLVAPPRIYDNTWYRVSFSWVPGAGSTGDFTVHAQNLNSGAPWASRYSATDFTFTPSAVQFGFGSVNDTGAFDNIRINVPVLGETFESQTIGTNTLPAGWTLIDAKGTVAPAHYVNVIGSNGLGGSAGVAGEVNAVGSDTTRAELPSRYIVGPTLFDSTRPIEGRFDVKISSAPAAGANDAIFFFGDIGSGYAGGGANALSLKLVEMNSAHLGNGIGNLLVNDTSVKIANDTWYHVEFDWQPTAESDGVFSASVFDALSGNQMGNTLSTEFTLNPWLIQFGFGSLNDKAVFDNILIVPEPSSLVLAILSILCLGLARRRTRR